MKRKKETENTKNKLVKLEVNENEKKFSSYLLNRIIKENHNLPIKLAIFNKSHNFKNLLATLSAKQVNIYDTQHLGNNLDLFLHYTGESKESLQSCCWLDTPRGWKFDGEMKSTTEELENQPPEECYLAIAGDSTIISIMSISHYQIIQQLRGHSKPILHLIQPSGSRFSNFLLSNSRDGFIKLWHWPSGNCVVTLPVPSILLAADQREGHFLILTSNGKLKEYTIQNTLDNYQIVEGNTIKNQSKNTFDFLQVTQSGRLVAKTMAGKIIIFHLNQENNWEVESEWSLQNDTSSRSRFDVNLDESFLCIGDVDGSVFIYKLNTGRLVHRLQHKQSKADVFCCCFSHPDEQSICQVGDSPHLLRWQFVDPTIIEKFDE